MANICVIQGHPDGNHPHFGTALANAYAEGAESQGHTVSEIVVAGLQLDFLRTSEDFETDPAPDILAERAKIDAADHVVIIFPLWLGGAPALLKAFLEQIARGGYFIEDAKSPNEMPKPRMKGKSLRIIVTMGMPSLIYNTWFGANSLKGLEKGMFGLSGFSPIRHKLIGMIGVDDEARHKKWLGSVRRLGERGI